MTPIRPCSSKRESASRRTEVEGVRLVEVGSEFQLCVDGCDTRSQSKVHMLTNTLAAIGGIPTGYRACRRHELQSTESLVNVVGKVIDTVLSMPGNGVLSLVGTVQ